MFSFRRKPKKEDFNSGIRTSPSLPELSSQGIPWPENLVDIAAIRQTPPPEAPQQGAAKTSIQGIDHTPIPFHKPFRGSPGKQQDGPISSLYMSSPPSAFDAHKLHNGTAHTRKLSQRRAPRSNPPTFNLMVSAPFLVCMTRLLNTMIGGWRARHREDVLASSTSRYRGHLAHRNRGSTGCCRSVFTWNDKTYSVYTDCLRRNLRVALRSSAVLRDRHSG